MQYRQNGLPFKEISLWDVSINRQGDPKAAISKFEDVLFNTDEKVNSKTYENKRVIVLFISHIIPPNTYKKEFSVPENPTPADQIYKVEMELIHDPLNCMYPHCIFRFTFEGNIVTKSNYEDGFGKKNRTMSRLREMCKATLHGMIVRKEVSFLKNL